MKQSRISLRNTAGVSISCASHPHPAQSGQHKEASGRQTGQQRAIGGPASERLGEQASPNPVFLCLCDLRAAQSLRWAARSLCAAMFFATPQSSGQDSRIQPDVVLSLCRSLEADLRCYRCCLAKAGYQGRIAQSREGAGQMKWS
ncbi:unnamed protein product [[Candida] boidinii]|nr:unnamed protein product [[Candida] boidinii]